MRRRGLIVGAGLAAPFVIAGVAGVRFAARAGTARRRGQPLAPGVPAPEPSAGLVASVALDTLINLPMALLSSVGSPSHIARASAELDEAVAFYDKVGWLHDHRQRHPGPTVGPDAQLSREGDLEVLRFDSGWQPVEGEPGGERWRSCTANSVVPVTLLRHPGGPRPWLVLVHGQGMGRASDVRMLRARHLHERLGVNVAMPVLPLHGARKATLAPDQQFVSNVYLLNNVLGLTQAVWDLRRLLLWLRTDQGATDVGVLGVSLGSYVSSLLSTLEGDLACVVAVVPTSSLADALRAAEPVFPSRARLHQGLHDDRSTAVHSVVSPLAGPCLVPHDRRFIVAGQGDQVASPAGAAELWRHWEEPSIEWRPRGHLTTFRSAAYDDHIATVLRRSGLEGG